MDLNLLLERFEREYLDPNSITPMRRVEQLRILRRFAAGLTHPLDALTAQDVSTFVGAEIQRGLHPNTALKYLIMLRSFITWAYHARLIEDRRYAELKAISNPRGSTFRQAPKPYKAQEVREFYAQLAAKYPALPSSGPGSRMLRQFMRGRSRRLHRHLWRHARRLQYEAQVALALEQGLRRKEIFDLTIPAMHYDNDEVVVLTAKQGPGREVRRVVPYTTHARACVMEWLDFRSLLRPPHDSPWLALPRVGDLDTQLAPQTIRVLGRSLEPIGPEWHWHRFRHTCATEWLRTGKIPLEKLRVYLGHSSLERTLAYAELLGTDISKSFDAAEADFAKQLGLVAA